MILYYNGFMIITRGNDKLVKFIECHIIISIFDSNVLIINDTNKSSKSPRKLSEIDL